MLFRSNEYQSDPFEIVFNGSMEAREVNLTFREIPQTFSLHQNYPNPFNPVTSLQYDLPKEAFVTLSIYDLMGREINRLVHTTQEPGFKSVQWNATDFHGKPVSAGIYMYQIHTDGFIQTRKMVLLK